MKNILIADDHTVIRKGLRQILLENYPSVKIEEAGDAETLIKKAMTSNWDLIICDISMPGRNGLDVLRYAKENFPDIPVLMLSSYPEEQYAIRTIKAGAAGYLNKEAAPAELIKATERILQGRKFIPETVAEKLAGYLELGNSEKQPGELLSDRELEVFKLIASGKQVFEIAEELLLSTSTISTFRARILNKLDMKTNADMTRYCVEHHLL